jgi:hypothetical protein
MRRRWKTIFMSRYSLRIVCSLQKWVPSYSKFTRMSSWYATVWEWVMCSFVFRPNHHSRLPGWRKSPLPKFIDLCRFKWRMLRPNVLSLGRILHIQPQLSSMWRWSSSFRWQHRTVYELSMPVLYVLWVFPREDVSVPRFLDRLSSDVSRRTMHARWMHDPILMHTWLHQSGWLWRILLEIRWRHRLRIYEISNSTLS